MCHPLINMSIIINAATESNLELSDVNAVMETNPELSDANVVMENNPKLSEANTKKRKKNPASSTGKGAYSLKS